MAETLDQAKERVRQSFLGKNGIHGVGISRSQQAIRVYVGPGDASRAQDTLEDLKKSAAPFTVIITEEEQPRAL